MERYAKGRREPIADDRLRSIRTKLDRELSVLGEAGASERLKEAFGASPGDLASAANAGRRRKERKK